MHKRMTGAYCLIVFTHYADGSDVACVLAAIVWAIGCADGSDEDFIE